MFSTTKTNSPNIVELMAVVLTLKAKLRYKFKEQLAAAVVVALKRPFELIFG